MEWVDVLAGGLNDLQQEQSDRLTEAVARLCEQEPVQYILGEAEFAERWFEVNKAVLIPRPETEELVEQALQLGEGLTATSTRTTGNGNALRVLDIGTGSGCIAISLALAHSEWQLSAWDISEEALAVARSNAERLGARNISFERVDILEESKAPRPTTDNDRSVGRCFDMIVSNPPYICDSERKDMERNVLEHEPHGALFVPDNDPLLFYRAIALFAAGTPLVLEINRAYGSDTKALLEQLGYTDVKIIRDQYNNERIITAQ